MITRKLREVESRKLKVERTSKIQPTTCKLFSHRDQGTADKDTGASEGDGDNRICVAALSDLHIRLAIYRFDSKSNILRKRRLLLLPSSFIWWPLTRAKDDLRKFYD